MDPILNLAQQIESSDQLFNAGIGKGFSKQVDTSIRSDKIFWIDNIENEEIQWLRDIFEGLKITFKEYFYLPIKRYEFHLAKYEKGGFYRLHTDRHVKKPGRLVSCVLYLSTCPVDQGGELILYDEELQPIKIRPERGKLIVFDSGLEHEVKKTGVDRWSITGGLRSDLHPSLRLS